MKKLLNIVLLLSTLGTYAQIIEVKQDGTGDFTIIQEAMDFAQQNDTVLVWPGTYFENIDFNGKSLTLASLMLTTGDESYKYNTIIDGGQNGSCIVAIFVNETYSVKINGLTIRNGNGQESGSLGWTFGGGIYIDDNVISNISQCVIKDNRCNRSGGGIYLGQNSSRLITNCIIHNNFSNKSGGGLSTSISSALLIGGTSIFNNHTYGTGGGISISWDANCIFDSINRCSIYSNYANRGCEVHKSSALEMKLYLDTCTVLLPDTYFISSIDDEGYQNYSIDIFVDDGLIEPYDGNLYVNPSNGSNENNGTSSEEPLRSIAFAYSKIYIDSLNKNTIYLANGIYSDTTNSEKFPLNIRPYTNVVGQSRDGVILDGNRNSYLIKGNNSITDYSYQRMTFQGGPEPNYESFETEKLLAYLYVDNDRLLLDSLVFRDSYALSWDGILSYYQADSSIINNCEFYGNTGGYTIRTSATDKIHFLNNNIFYNNNPDYDNPINIGGYTFEVGGQGITIIQNSLFFDNERLTLASTLGQDLHLINCTFTGNTNVSETSSLGVFGAKMTLYNCISFNEGLFPLHISPFEVQQEIVSHLTINNSLIYGGIGSISYSSLCWYQDSSWCYVHYDSTNIDADPVFLGMWGDPYMISDGSPCIDAGTLANLPDFIEISEFDLAGNPRIVGDSIDMGAYEWNPTIVGFNEIGPGNREEKPKLLKVSPNPFDWGTYIEISAYAKASADKEVKVEIYDNYGILVRNILTTTLAQDQKILWYGDDNNGNPLSAGVYYIVMFSGEREVESLKVVKK